MPAWQIREVLARPEDILSFRAGLLVLMAFPIIEAVASTNGTTATTSPVINLPTGIVADETLLILVRNAAGGTITAPNEGTDWVQLFEDGSDASNDTTALFWRKADGTEGATVTFTFGTSGKFAALAWRISGTADPTVTPPEFATLVTGTSTLPDPGSLSPTGGAKDYLWIWMGGWEGEQTSPPAGNPTNYTNPIGADSGTGGAVATNCRVANARRNLNAATEDPPSWTISASDDWTATVVAVYPGFSERPTTTLFVSDEFNRPNTVAGQSIGSDWTVSEIVSGNASILAQKLFIIAPAMGRFRAGTFSADQRASMRIGAISTSDETGPAVRLSGTHDNLSGYAALFEAIVPALRIKKFVNQSADSGTVLRSLGISLAANDRIDIEAVGTLIRVFRNGQRVMEVTDSAIATGDPGWLAATTSEVGQEWDDFVATNAPDVADIHPGDERFDEPLSVVLSLLPIVSDVVGVGQVFTETPSETFSLTSASSDVTVLPETQSATVVFEATASDAFVLTETTSQSIVFVVTESEGKVYTDTPDTTAVLASTASDLFAATDTLAQTIIVSPEETEQGVATEQASQELIFATTSAETTSLQPEVPSEAFTIGPFDSDAFTAVALLDAVVVLISTATDEVGAQVLTETPSVSFALTPLVVDPSVLVDTAAQTMDFITAQTETASLQPETPSESAVLVTTEADFSTSVSTLDVALVLTPASTDSVGAQVFEETPSLTVVLVVESTLAHLVEEVENQLIARDDKTLTKVISPAEVDVQTADDDPSETVVFAVTATDDVAGQVFTETPSVTAVFASTTTDAATDVEPLSVSAVLIVEESEVLVLPESRTVTAEFATADADVVSLVDAPSVDEAFVLTSADTALAVDTTSVTAVLSPQEAENASFVDLPSLTEVIAGTPIDSAVLVDDRTLSVLFDPTSTEAISGGLAEFPVASLRIYAHWSK